MAATAGYSRGCRGTAAWCSAGPRPPTSTPGLEGRLPGLASCQEYEVSVTAVQYSVAKPGGRARPSLWTADQIVMMGLAGVAYGE